MLGVLLALLGGIAFGTVPLTVRRGLQRVPNSTLAAAAQNVVGLAVCGVVALTRTQFEGDILPFLLIGVLVPGLSTVLLVQSVRLAGPARASVIMNTAPLVSVLAALVLLDEPFHVALLAGCVLMVLGGVVLARERVRPEHVAGLGLVLAFVTGLSFATRDNVVRWLTLDSRAGPQLAGAATLAAAAAATLALFFLEVRGKRGSGRLVARSFAAFWPAGIALGLAYITMYEAFFRSRVSIVSPLLGTASFWAVLLSALLLRRVELVGRTLVIGTILIVGGGALIGIFR